ncbi:MAG: hypothetical protein KC646_11530 [Candidatus Cloacimonetes bacterium]|nr:hypothetical protein [Candidatus Cloacimonadota bacterium]
MNREPIAVVGMSCMFAGAKTKESFWSRIRDKELQTKEVSKERLGLEPHHLLAKKGTVDKTYSKHCAFVDYDVDLSKYESKIPKLSQLDPYFHWCLHVVNEALEDADLLSSKSLNDTGLILGNLTFATEKAEEASEDYLLSLVSSAHKKNIGPNTNIDSRNFHQSALPAQVCSEFFGLGIQSYALDAACASSLYVIHLACEQIWTKQAKQMIALGVNRSEMVALQVGFSQLGAYSANNQCRPFDENADGLVVGEGGGALILKPLSQALDDGDQIHCVIRGSGLSCDGKDGGLLAPSHDGQVRALDKAYQSSGIDPKTIDVVECHGTATNVGDACEIKTLKKVFGDNQNQSVGIGSIKSLFGHCLSAAGMASSIKVIMALKEKALPPTLFTQPASRLDLESSPLYLIDKAIEWKQPSKHPRRGAVSGFGFGGTNAHIIFEEFDSNFHAELLKTHNNQNLQDQDISIISAECEFAQIKNLDDLHELLISDKDIFSELPKDRWPKFNWDKLLDHPIRGGFLEDQEVLVKNFKMTPNEVKRLLPQQLLVLQVAAKAIKKHEALDLKNAGIIVGLNWNANIAEHTIRLKSPRSIQKILSHLDLNASDSEFKQLLNQYKDSICPAINSDDVIGDIPNFPANRISSEMDIQGPSYVVFQEEGSAYKALEIARQALLSGETDTMVVGAVDIPLDFKSVLAEKDLFYQKVPMSDGAVVLVLRLKKQALLDKNPILANILKLDNFSRDDLKLNDYLKANKVQLLESTSPDRLTIDSALNVSLSSIKTQIGDTRSVQFLSSAMSGLLSLTRCFIPSNAKDYKDNGFFVPNTPKPWLQNKVDGSRRVLVHSYHSEGFHQTMLLEEHNDQIAPINSSSQKLFFFQASGLQDLKDKLSQQDYSLDLSTRQQNDLTLSMIATKDNLSERTQRALDLLDKNPTKVWDPSGIYFTDTPMMDKGKLAFLFPGFGNLYADMGRELLLKFPHLTQRICSESKYAKILSCEDKLWHNNGVDLFDMSVFEISFATTFHSWIFSSLFVEDFKIQPDQILGFSGGEINCLSALKVWNMDEYYECAQHDKVFSHQAAGEFFSVQKYFDTDETIKWSSYLVYLSETELKDKLKDWDRVFLTMVNTSKECMIAGITKDTENFINSLSCHTVKIPIPQVYHCDIMDLDKPALLDLWSNPVKAPQGIDFYAHATGKPYPLTQKSVSEAITKTCCECVDFQPVVQNAYADQARLFMEVGPQGSVTRHVQNILDGKEHFAVATNTAERSDENQLFHSLAMLATHGLRMDLSLLGEPKLVKSKKQLSIQATVGRTLGQFDVDSFVQELNKIQTIPKAKSEPIGLVSKKKPKVVTKVMPPKTPSNEVKPQINHKIQNINTINEPQRMIMSESTPQQNPLQLTGEQQSDFLKVQSAIIDAHENFLRDQQDLMRIEQILLGSPVQALPSHNAPSYSNNETVVLPVAPHPAPVAPPVNPAQEPIWNKEDILNFSHGKIADVFGPEFDIIDTYKQRTRFPSPPYLLVDRIMEIDGKLHEFKPSSVVTEFDVKPEDWFLIGDRCPISVCIESGQADLWLISFLGIDHKVKGERVYRLLGADFTFFDDFPKAPCTLRYEIHIKSFTQNDGTWLFFFDGVGYCDGVKFIEWVNGCAGYFTPAELSEKKQYKMPVWSKPENAIEYNPVRICRKQDFNKNEIRALVDGNIYECFGQGFEVPFKEDAAHQNTFPKWSNHDICMVDNIHIRRTDGMHGLGYIEADLALDDNHWYFTSHFVGDNVMPGTLMLDGCSQILEFYLLYLGFGFQARGGRFRPILNNQIKVKCRGQVIPGMKDLKYYLHITKIEPGHNPKVWADAVLTSEGKEVVIIDSLGFEIYYDNLPALPAVGQQAFDMYGRPVVTNETQLIELTVGKPSTYFGEHYEIFDQDRQISRMPNPPYACITRVTEITGEKQNLKVGATMVNEFDMSADDWYFQINQGLMPFCVFNEVVLQPCGLLPQLLELDCMSKSDRFIRNLGGKMITYQDIPAQDNRIIAEVKLTEMVNTPGAFMVKYDGRYTLSDGSLLAEGVDLHFGFYSQEALAASPGLTLAKDVKEALESANAQAPAMELAQLPTPMGIGTQLKLPVGPGLFFDRVAEFRPDGGRYKNGYITVEKDVDETEWIFYSHFYMDPVVPGSYSLDAMTQVAKYVMLYHGLDQREGTPYFRINFDQWMDWQYRGQILQHNDKIIYEVEVKELVDGVNPYIIISGRVFCDGKFIYQLDNVRVTIQYS